MNIKNKISHHNQFIHGAKYKVTNLKGDKVVVICERWSNLNTTNIIFNVIDGGTLRINDIIDKPYNLI